MQIVEGFNTSKLRGAGIRVYEYASSTTIRKAKVQLEALLWMCHDAHEAMQTAGMAEDGVVRRKRSILHAAQEAGLLDPERLQTLRLIDTENRTICPLCLNRIAAADFFKRSEQAEGRETYDLTTTAVSLFHIQELRVGKFQHKVYNLGWGHQFCNVVVKDAGIMPTLEWMRGVLDNQPSQDLEEEWQSVEKAVDR